MHSARPFILVFATLAVAACSGVLDDGTGGSGGGASTSSGNTPSGMPCEVAEIVQAHCASCHGNPPTSAAKQSLLTPADWRAPSPTNPSRSNGEVSVERMSATESPMPPGVHLDSALITVIADWVAAGMPEGNCETMNVDDPLLDADPICTSMDMWPAGEDEVSGKDESEMFPGMPCIDCHSNPAKYNFDEGGRDFEIAGTVFPTGHEPDRCAGADGTNLTDLIVHIEDANGRTWDLRPNASGNFSIASRDAQVAFPYSAKVISKDGERAMSAKVDNGDCNICHTQNGSSGPNPMDPVAPGRIVPIAP